MPEANPYMSPTMRSAALAAADERASFITKTYLHLIGAIGALVIIEAMLLSLPITESVVMPMIQGRGWLVVLGLFMFTSWIANRWASSDASRGLQYAGLALYTVAQAVILLPLLYVAMHYSNDPNVIPAAGLATLVLFGAMTAVVFVTRKDFSFLRTGLMYAGFAALGLIVVAILFQFSLGPIFTYAMIAFACGYILYDTSNVLHHYRTDQYVAASLALFASVALMFWYVLRLFMSRD